MINFPDVSNYDSGWQIPQGTPAVVARTTLSTTYTDPSYRDFQNQAANLGAKFAAYHWLNHGRIAAQAMFAFAHANGAPMMIDAEDMPGNTGYNGPNTVGDITSFATEYRKLGGKCSVIYLPHWYWQDRMGAPSLTPLINAGLHLVSSNYSGHGGWDPYGGMTPFQWQYTDKPHDYNMFNGTIDELWNIYTGADTMGAQPTTANFQQALQDAGFLEGTGVDDDWGPNTQRSLTNAFIAAKQSGTPGPAGPAGPAGAPGAPGVDGKTPTKVTIGGDVVAWE
jgi:hypothetical protein